MTDPVEGFADVTENDSNFFTFVQCPAKGVVEIKTLVNSGISRNKARVKRRQESYQESLKERLADELRPMLCRPF